MKRIRYSKEGEILTSKQSFQTNEGLFQLQINTNALTYTLVTPVVNTAHYFGGGKGEVNTLSEVKKLAKAKLVSLGVVFESETRNTIALAMYIMIL